MTGANSRIRPAIAVAALLTAGCVAQAVEPDGRVGFRHEWVATGSAVPIEASGPGPGDSAILRVVVRSESPIRDARVRIEAPLGIEVLTASGTELADSGLVLGDLALGRSLTIDFRVVAPRTGGGIVAIRLEGLAPDGSPFSEGTGVPVGKPGTAPELRHGALEFPTGGGGTRP